MTTRALNNTLNETWFERRQGKDSPVDDIVSERQDAFLVFTDGIMRVRMMFVVDSQQPELRILPSEEGDEDKGHIAFLLKNCHSRHDIEGECDWAEFLELVQAAREQFPKLQQLDNALVYTVDQIEKKPVIPWYQTRQETMTVDDDWDWLSLRLTEFTGTIFSLWLSSDENAQDVRRLNNWLDVLCKKLGEGLPQGKREGFWWYRVNQPENYLDACPTPEWLLPQQITRTPLEDWTIDSQIAALRLTSTPCVFGDLEENWNKGHGFSLQRMLLAPGAELDRDSPHHFVLDARYLSRLQGEETNHRIMTIQRRFPMDNAQLEALCASTTRMICGFHLIQGPPGTGKTRMHHEQWSRHSSEGVAKALRAHPDINDWVGSLYRYRTVSNQLAKLSGQEPTTDKSPAALKPHECTLGVANKSKPLKRARLREIRAAYNSIASKLLVHASIVATTLINVSCELLKDTFRPVFLVVDGATQCREGDTVIALTYPSLRGVVLVGDETEVPPRVTSEYAYAGNENAMYLARPFIRRLRKSHYPCTVLRINYRDPWDVLQNNSWLLDIVRQEEQVVPASPAFHDHPSADEEKVENGSLADHFEKVLRW
ncbi:uncharacterized protein BDV14DRAFT_196358 [Aspergillus stella-maris]|uniref:uncharacterized protein n=1 Tax=Aspergillus stella-maris TaxID=1810926 RepID=UPI003CCD24CE